MKLKYRLILDGALRDLALEEITSLTEVFRTKIVVRQDTGKEVTLESRTPLEAILLRTSLIVDAERILDVNPHEIDWDEVFSYNSRLEYGIPFTYKIEKTKGVDEKILSEIDSAIKEKYKNAKISLTDPQVILRIHKSTIEGRYEIALKLPTGREIAQKREPYYRLYAPSAAMSSILSRALVNIAKLKPVQVFLDPFCGTGSLTIEASLMGIFSIGIDINRRSIVIARMLAEVFGAEVKYIVGDARNINLDDNSVDGIATDPPYGISSPTYGVNIHDLYEEFLGEAHRLIKKGGRIVVCHTKSINVRELGERVGLKFEKTYHMYVHSKLVRHITILSA